MNGNFTLSSLVLSNIRNSPLFSPSINSNQRFLNFQNSKFSKFSHNFLYYSNTQLKYTSNSLNVQINSCNFNKFLNNVIQYSSVTQILHNFNTNDGGHFSAKSFDNGYIIIKHSEFQTCKSETINGRAISTTVPLELINCEFINCEGSFGGCIYSTCPILAISFTTFRNCKGHEQSGVLQMRQEQFLYNDKEVEKSTSKGVHINSSIIFNVKSNLFATAYICFKEYNKEHDKKFHHLSFSLTNCTRSKASSCVGIIEATNCFTEISYSFIKYCGADVHNGGFVLRQAKSININTCNFINNSHTSTTEISASVLLVYTNPEKSLIYNSYFIDNYNGGSKTITSEGGESIIIQDCIFTSSQYRALRCNPREIIQQNKFIDPSDSSYDYKELKKLKQRDVIYQNFLDQNEDNKEKAQKAFQGFLIGYLTTRDKGRFIDSNNGIVLFLILSASLLCITVSFLITKLSIGVAKRIVTTQINALTKRNNRLY